MVFLLLFVFLSSTTKTSSAEAKYREHLMVLIWIVSGWSRLL